MVNDESTKKIPCPKCNTVNFPSSAVCWQCGQPLNVQQSPPPNAPTPPQPVPVQPPVPGYVQPPPPDNTSTMVILGFISGALGLLCCPIFSIAGIIFGAIAQRRGNQLGIWIIVLSVATFLIGIVIFALFTVGFMHGFNGATRNIY